MDEMEKSLQDAVACGADGLKWACELLYEYYNSSLGMKRCLAFLNDENSCLISSDNEKQWAQNNNEALKIYSAMQKFGANVWFTALLKHWLQEKSTEEVLELLKGQYYYAVVEDVLSNNLRDT